MFAAAPVGRGWVYALALGLIALVACQDQSITGHSVQVETAAAPPSEAPKVDVSSTATGAMTIEWPPVGDATSYWWWEVSPTPTSPIEVTNPAVVLPPLLAGREYNFAVAAANTRGWGPMSSLVTVRAPVDWNRIAKRAAPFVYRVRFASCSGAGCANPIAMGYTILLPAPKRQTFCAAFSAPPDRTPWVRLPCWSGSSNLFFVTTYHTFCNASHRFPEFLDATGRVIYWSSSGCSGRYAGPTAHDVAGEFTTRGTGGIPRTSLAPEPGDEVVVLSASTNGRLAPVRANVIGTGLDVQEAAGPGFSGAAVHGAIALSGNLSGSLPGSPVLNGYGEVIGAFAQSSGAPNPGLLGAPTGYVLTW